MSLTAKKTEGNILNNCDVSEFNELAQKQREERFSGSRSGKLVLDKTTEVVPKHSRAFVGSAKSLGAGVFRAGSIGGNS